MNPQTTRIRGSLKLVGGSAAFALVFWGVFKRELAGERQVFFRLIAMATPGSVALIGLIELATGVPFTRFASAWIALQWWQRLLLGLLIVFSFFALIFGGIYLWLVPSA